MLFCFSFPTWNDINRAYTTYRNAKLIQINVMTGVKFNDFLSEQRKKKKKQEWTTVREKGLIIIVIIIIIIGMYKIRSTRRLSKNTACPLLSLCLFGLWRFQHQLYRCIKHTLHILQFSVTKFQFTVLETNLEQCFTMSKVC